MKIILSLLILCLISFNCLSQTKIASSANFMLEKKGYKEKKEYLYCIYNSSKEVVKTFDNSYYFGHMYAEKLIITSKKEGKDYRYNIFDIEKGDFITTWDNYKIESLNDSIFKVQPIDAVTKLSTQKWKVINKKGEQIIDRLFEGYSGPSYEESCKLIYSSDDRKTVKLYATDGSLKHSFDGYNMPDFDEGHLFVLNNEYKRGVINLNAEIIVPFEYESLNIQDEKLFGTILKNGKLICEIYTDIKRTKVEFTKEGNLVEKASYYDVKSDQNVDYWLVGNNTKETFYTTNYEMFLTGDGDVDKNDSSYFFYWRISQTYNDLYLLSYDGGYGSKTPIVVSKTEKVLICKSEDVVFCPQTLDGKPYTNTNFTILFDPSIRGSEKFFVLDKKNKPTPYKIFDQSGNAVLIEINDNGINKLALSDGEGTLKFFSKLEGMNKDHLTVDRNFFNNQEQFFFTKTEDGKLSISVFYLMNSSDDGLMCKTPAVFEHISKIYANEMYIHIVGFIKGKQVLAFCNRDKFTYLALDKIPEIKKLIYAENENPVPVKIDNKMATINLMLEFVAEPKYNSIIPYKDGDYSYCILNGKKGIGHSYNDGKFTEILPPEFDEIESVLGGDLWKVKKNGKYGVYYMQGKLSLDCIYDEIQLNGWDSGYIVKKDGKYGVMGYDSNVVHEIKYNSVEEMKKALNQD